MTIPTSTVWTMSGSVLVDSVRGQLRDLAAVPRRRYEVLLDAFEIGRSRARGDLEPTVAACQRVPTQPTVLAGLGLESWDVLRILAFNNTGSAELWLGDLDAAGEHLSIAANGGTPGNLLIPRLNAQAHLVLLDWSRGDPDRAAATARAAVAQFSDAGLPLAGQCARAYLALAAVAVDRDELDAVDRWLKLAAKAAVEPHAMLAVALMGARRDIREGRFDRGVTRVRAARDKVLTARTPRPLIDSAILTEADLLRREGDHVQATLLATQVTDPRQWAAVSHRVHLALDAGATPADNPTAWPPPTSPRQAVEQALRARCAQAAAARDNALTLLEQAVTIAAPRTMRWPFLHESATLAPLLTDRIERGTPEPEFALDLANRMAGAMPTEPTPASMLIVPLTDRESIMLRYLASTLSNTEIAHANFVTVNTVKTHQRMIYRKLAVSGRRAAVTRARELGLV